MNALEFCGIIAGFSSIGIVLCLIKLWKMSDDAYFMNIEIAHSELDCESLRRELFTLRKEVEKLKKR